MASHSSSPRKTVEQVVKENSRANGLAIIISNDYENNQELPTLNGTRKDNTNMRYTFEELKLAVISYHNMTHSEMMVLIRSVVTFNLYPPSYRRIVFVFSGHGKESFLLYTNDTRNVTINVEEIVMQFSEAAHLAKIPKVFLIDACRGDQINPGMMVPKGGKNVTQIVPADSNWLLAYSTLPRQKSYEEQGKGGVWMTKLAERLRTDPSSLNDILTTINRELVELYESNSSYPLQQPEFISRLHDCIYFLQEARGQSPAGRSPVSGGAKRGSPAGQLQRATSNPSPPRSKAPSTSGKNPTQSLPPGTGAGLTASKKKASSGTSAPKEPTTPNKDKLKWYSTVTKKKEPIFKSEKVAGTSRKYIGKAYIPQMCGWVTGDPKNTKGEAEEDAAAKLVAKLKIP